MWLLVAVLAGGSAWAADVIPTVELTPAGPTTPLPHVGSFYLKGPAGDLNAVRAVFIRTRTGAFGGFTACDDLERNLGTSKNDPKSSRKALFTVASGRHAPDALWNSAPSDLGRRSVLLSPVWTRASKDDKTFNVLIDDPSFFTSGSVVCLLVYREHERIESLSDALLADVEEAARKFTSCQKQEECERNVLQEFDAMLEKQLAKVDKAERASALDTVNTELWGALRRTLRTPDRVSKALDAWSAAVVPQLPVEDGELVALEEGTPQWHAVRRLAPTYLHLVVIPGRTPAEKATFAFFTDKGTRVEYVGLTAGVSHIYVAAQNVPPPASQREKLTVGPSALRFPESQVSVEDLLRFSEGKLWWRGAWVPIEHAKVEIEGVVREGIRATAADLSALSDFVQWSKSVGELLDRATQERGHSWEQLRSWMAKVYCEPGARTGGAKDGVCTFSSDKPFFGYKRLANSPFSELGTPLREHLTSVENWKSRAGELKVAVQTLEAKVDTRAQLRMGIEHKAFITELVTPVVSRAWIPLGGRMGSVYTLAFQVSQPNPVDQPMWSNAVDDWHRFAALELGIGLSDDFDPRGRVRGPEFTAGVPLMLGLALRPLPYVSVSGGAAFLSARHSTLEVEASKFSVGGYFSVGLQVNALDAIRAAYGKSLTTITGGK